MSHYHMEIVMPPTKDIRASVERLMKPFDENLGEEDEERLEGFWDFFVIGGRYSGAKVEAAVGEEPLKAFYEKLKAKKVTVSGVQFGKQSLDPSSQIAVVDEMWSKEFPAFSGKCPLFQHYNDQFDREKRIIPVDVCTVETMPHGLNCYTLLIAEPDEDGGAAELFHKSIWNGVTHQDTTFSGNVKEALEKYQRLVSGYKRDYAEKCYVKSDWLVVTLDYHS